jgi:hypothetical protein
MPRCFSLSRKKAEDALSESSKSPANHIGLGKIEPFRQLAQQALILGPQPKRLELGRHPALAADPAKPAVNVSPRDPTEVGRLYVATESTNGLGEIRREHLHSPEHRRLLDDQRRQNLEQAWLEFTREEHVFYRDRTPVLGHVAIGDEKAFANEAAHNAGEPGVAPSALEHR